MPRKRIIFEKQEESRSWIVAGDELHSQELAVRSTLTRAGEGKADASWIDSIIFETATAPAVVISMRQMRLAQRYTPPQRFGFGSV